MLARCFRLEPGPLPIVAALTLLVLLLTPAAAVSAPQPVRQALDCNSDLFIDIPPTVEAGDTFTVVLTVINGVSTDALNADVGQRFDVISFFPSCTSTMPCDEDTALPVSFVGPVITDCMVDDPWTTTAVGGVVAGTQIDFTFTGGAGPTTPNGLFLPAAMVAGGTSSCQLEFDVMVDPMFTGTISMEATTDGICDPSGVMLNSSAEATANLTVEPMTVPTVGETGLALLALLLGLAAWSILRRRAAVGAP